MGFGHLYEALSVIEDIANDPALRAVVDRCDKTTREAFAELLSYVSDGDRREDLVRIAGGVRNNLTFHYDKSGKLVSRAIEAQARQGKRSSLTRASATSEWHFAIADLVVDEVVCHQIWKIPVSDHELADADGLVGQIHDIFLALIRFASGFIWKYLRA
jgi:hypothetical protein